MVRPASMPARFVDLDRQTPMFPPYDLREWVPAGASHLLRNMEGEARQVPGRTRRSISVCTVGDRVDLEIFVAEFPGRCRDSCMSLHKIAFSVRG